MKKMNKIKKILKKIFKNKIVLIVLGVILIAAIILFMVFGFRKEESQSVELSNNLKELGVEFYEDFYYKQIGKDDKERKEFLEKYKDIGIKINLDSLSRYKKEETEEILKQFVNNKTKKECDKTNSMVVIYPKNPYGQNDYKIDAQLVCGFEETEEK